MLAWFRNLPILIKLVLTFTLISLGTLGIGLLGVEGINREAQLVSSVYNHNVIPFDTLQGVSLHLATIRLREVAHIASDSPAAMESMQQEIMGDAAALAKELATLAAQTPDAAAQTSIATMTTDLAEYQKLLQEVLKSSTEFTKEEAAYQSNQAGAEIINRMFAQLSTLKTLTIAMAGKDLATADRIAADLQRILAGGLVAVVALSLLSGFVISRGVAAPLKAGVELAQMVAQGDLSKTLAVDRTDEVGRLGQAMNEMCHSVGSMVSQVSLASDKITDATEQQAAALEQTSSSVVEIDAMVQRTAENTRHANHEIDQSSTVMQQAINSLQELTESMTAITEASQNTAKIIKTIDEIAFQTNLLALNAAVEAARAGESGAGFAVVADEVRALAQRSADAAKNTSALIEDTINKIGIGSELVARVNKDFTLAGKNTKSEVMIINEIATSMDELSKGVAQISQAIQHVGQVAQNNMGTATMLREEINRFHTGEPQTTALTVRA